MNFADTQADGTEVSYKVIATRTNGQKTSYNYVDNVSYEDNGTVVLKGNSQSSEGTMIRRDFVLERATVADLELRVIRK